MKTPACTWFRRSAAVCPSSLRTLMWVWSSFRVCVPIIRPAVPSLRLIDESGTFRERESERETSGVEATRLSSSPAGVPVTPKRQQSALCSKKVIIKHGENSDFFFLCVWKVIIKHFSCHDGGLTSEGGSSQLSSKPSSRVWRRSHFFWAASSSTSASAGGDLPGEKRLKMNTSAAASNFSLCRSANGQVHLKPYSIK